MRSRTALRRRPRSRTVSPVPPCNIAATRASKSHVDHPRPAIRLPDWLVQNRNFVLLWAAYGVAAIGDHLSEIALLKSRDALARPDGTRVQALISFGFFLPFVILGPLAGWWSDRSSRKITMIVADLLRAALVWNLAILVPALARWLDPHGFGRLLDRHSAGGGRSAGGVLLAGPAGDAADADPR